MGNSRGAERLVHLSPAGPLPTGSRWRQWRRDVEGRNPQPQLQRSPRLLPLCCRPPLDPLPFLVLSSLCPLPLPSTALMASLLKQHLPCSSLYSGPGPEVTVRAGHTGVYFPKLEVKCGVI